MKTIVVILALVAAVCAGCVPVVPPSQNSSPKVKIEAEAVISGLNDIDAVTATVQFNVVDEECLPIDYLKGLGGIRVRAHRYESTPVRSVGAGRYKATLYDDFYKTQRLYFWRKSCSWQVEGVTFEIHKGAATIRSSTSRDRLTHGSALRYCTWAPNTLEDVCTGVARSGQGVFTVDILPAKRAM